MFIHRDPTSHRRHTLWVADRDPLAVPVGRTPLLACKPTDIWKPAPIGLDERGQLVTVPLMWNSHADRRRCPGQGKTFAARLLALYAALDPYVQLDVFDAKGSPDWRKFALVADSCAFGLTPTRDGLPPEILLDTLERASRPTSQDRYHRLSEMPTERLPGGQAHPGDRPRPAATGCRSGCWCWTSSRSTSTSASISKEIAALLVFLVKVAPGAGVILIDATQKPSGIGDRAGRPAVHQLPRQPSPSGSGCGPRAGRCRSCASAQGAYGEGLDTSTLLPQYKGVGILRGASDASPTVRTYLADGQDAERILTAARALRERAGTLSGMAAGLEVDRPPARDVLADVLAVFGGDAGLHWPVLAERLAARIPDRWADATAEAISAQCRGRGVPSVDVKTFGQVAQGLPPGRRRERGEPVTMPLPGRAAATSADLRKRGGAATRRYPRPRLTCAVAGSGTGGPSAAREAPWGERPPLPGLPRPGVRAALLPHLARGVAGSVAGGPPGRIPRGPPRRIRRGLRRRRGLSSKE